MGLGLEEYFLKVSLDRPGEACVIVGRPPRASQVVTSLLVFLVQSCPDPAVYGVVQSGDHVGRTCMVKWFKLRPTGDDVEVSLLTCFFSGGGGSRERGEAWLMPAWCMLQLIGEEEDVSVYDIADHPDFRFRTTDIVIRIGNTEDGALPKEDEVGVPSRFTCWAVPALPDTAASCLQEVIELSV